MTTEISHINVQYSKTIGRGEQFGPGFNYPVFVARGKEGIMYVLCRGSEFRPEGVRVTVCTTDEEYISTFARGADSGLDAKPIVNGEFEQLAFI